MFAWWKNRRRKKILRDHPIAEGEWADTLAQLPLIRTLDAARQAELRALATWFMHDKDFYGGGDMDVVRPVQLVIAAQSCLPVLHMGYDWLEGWYSVYVYPGAFRTRQSWRNRDGLVEEDKRVLAGAAHQRGGMVLSWNNVTEDVADADDGNNVVIHEIAHKIDMRNGPADGYPPLHRGMSARRWADVMQRAFDELNEQTRRGRPRIDPYAATEPAEFFAVTSEYYFEAPETLKRVFPDVHQQLGLFYQGGPKAA
ncbi:MAG: M90 family metallopeptidase [Pseudomonadota bacterium]